MKKIIIAMLILLCFSQVMFSQYNRFNQNGTNHFTDKRNYLNSGKIFHSEIHYLPYKKDSSDVILFFRLSYDLLTFEKYSKHSFNNEVFYAIPIVEAEFEDNEGIIRKRIVWQDTIFTNDFAKTISKTDFIQGKLNTKIATQNYIVMVRLSDNTNRNIRKMIFKDTASHNYFLKNIIGKPIFTYIKNTDSQQFYPYILNNNVNFPSKNPLILIPVSYRNDFVKYYYNCSFIKPKEGSGLKWSSQFNISGFLIPKKESSLEMENNNNDNIVLQIIPFKKYLNFNIGILELSLPVDEIVPGNYELKIAGNNSSDTLHYKFRVVWEDMPLVLQKLKLAIESMYYVLNDKDYEKMLDADRDNYSKEILKYWKKQDPTKSTPYNEAMAEYFKRVDYAIYNFRSFTQKNGLKTDRGKIYILYGKPSQISKDFKQQKTYEIWNYNHLKKEFVFLRYDNDKYKLIDIKNK